MIAARLVAGGVAILLNIMVLDAVKAAAIDTERWGIFADHTDWIRLAILSPTPLVGALGFLIVLLGVRSRSHRWPFIGAVLIFLSGYIGLAIGFAPYLAPYGLMFRQAVAAQNSLQFLLIGTSVLLPLILIYTVFVYWTFRGKVGADAGYH